MHGTNVKIMCVHIILICSYTYVSINQTIVISHSNTFCTSEWLPFAK